MEAEEGRKISWKDFVIKKSWVLLILIPLVITLMVRLEPMKLIPLERSAQSNVFNYYRSMLSAEIEKQFPNLPEQQKASLIEKKFQELIKSADKTQIENAIKQNADAIKSRLQYQSGKNTYVYLGDIDSYYWLRQSRNIVEKGTQCDIIKDNVCYDSYTLAPILLEKPKYYYPIAIVWLYKFLKIFNPDISLMQASFLTPLAFALIFTIPLFLLLKKIGNNFVAVIGTVLVSVNQNVLTRSLGSDSDIVNVFFQIFFLWIAIECFYASTAKKKVIWASIAGALLSIYSLFWIGWWYLADLFILALIVKWAYTALQKWYETRRLSLNDLKEPLRQLAFPALSFLAVILLFFAVIFRSPSTLWGVVTTQFQVLALKAATSTDYWPNVLTTVAEFNSMGIDSIISSFGSLSLGRYFITFYLMALLGIVYLIFPTTKFINKNKAAFSLFLLANWIVYLLMKKLAMGKLVFLLIIPVLIGIFLHIMAKEKETFHPDMVFLLTIIICLVTYFSLMGARFLFLMAAPVVIFIAIFIERTLSIIVSTLARLSKLPKLATHISIVILIALFLITPVRIGFATAQNYLPNVSDGWVETLEKINQSSKPDAIINSWWDFGHWFKYFADRRVTLDGSSQANPQLHWLGKLLLTSNETVAVGILRMLDCGGNDAFSSINKKLNDTPHSIDVLNKLIVEKKEKAADILAEHEFSPDETENVLQYTHCNPPEDFLITSQDMISKSGVWAHFGSWDFRRAYLSINLGNVPEAELIKKFKEDYDIDEATTNAWIQELNSLNSEEQINSWISPWPSYAGWFDCSRIDSKNLRCGFVEGLNVDINIDTMEADIETPRGILHPNVIAYPKNNRIEIKEFSNTVGLGITLSPSGDRIYVMAPQLASSLFTRLFFLDGYGLNSFEKFHETSTVYGERIITWKVKWEAEDK